MRTNRKKSLAASVATASLALFSFFSQSAFATPYYWKPFRASTACYSILAFTNQQVQSFQIQVDQCIGDYGVFVCPSYPVPLPRTSNASLEQCIAAEAPPLCNAFANKYGKACVGSRAPRSDCSKANLGNFAYNSSTLQQLRCVTKPVGAP